MRTKTFLAVVVALSVTLSGCSTEDSTPSREEQQQAALQAEWDELDEAKKDDLCAAYDNGGQAHPVFMEFLDEVCP